MSGAVMLVCGKEAKLIVFMGMNSPLRIRLDKHVEVRSQDVHVEFALNDRMPRIENDNPCSTQFANVSQSRECSFRLGQSAFP